MGSGAGGGSLLYWGLGIDIVNLPGVGVLRLGIGYVFGAAFLMVTLPMLLTLRRGWILWEKDC